jgi:hypothetical protein
MLACKSSQVTPAVTSIRTSNRPSSGNCMSGAAAARAGEQATSMSKMSKRKNRRIFFTPLLLYLIPTLPGWG